MRLLAAFCGAALTVTAPAFAANELWVTIDEAQLHSLEQPVGSIVVANPSIADVTVRSKRELIFFGRMPGTTKVYFFDEKGERFATLDVRVRTPRNRLLTLQSGGTQYSFSCTTHCEQTFMVGDGTNNSRAVMGTVAGQADQKLQMASQASRGISNGRTSQSSLPNQPSEEANVPAEAPPAPPES